MQCRISLRYCVSFCDCLKELSPFESPDNINGKLLDIKVEENVTKVACYYFT